MRIGSLFTGYGGLDMAVAAAFDGRVVWHSEINKAASKILAHHWPELPNHGDITTIDWAGVEPIDILTGGFPCQDLSSAGKRAGLRPGTRSGLWAHMAYAIDQLRPGLVVIENVRGLLSANAHSDMEPCPWCLGDGSEVHPLRALGAVLGDLASLGYDASWCGLRAADAGAAHGRFRIFIAARDTNGARDTSLRAIPVEVADANRAGGLVDADANCEGRLQERGLLGQERGWSGDSGAATLPDPVGDDAGGALEGVGRGADSVRVRGAGYDDLDLARSDEREVDEPDDDTGIDVDARGPADLSWDVYEPAIRRWEDILGRAAPSPTEPRPGGEPRLSPRFVEWLMGLPDGHVTKVPGLSRADQLRALGNGVVPQQAALALPLLISRIWGPA